jgi:hypothetical protein
MFRFHASKGFKFRREARGPRLEINKTCRRTVGPASFVLVLSVSLFSIDVPKLMMMLLINSVIGKVYSMRKAQSAVSPITSLHVSL